MSGSGGGGGGGGGGGSGSGGTTLNCNIVESVPLNSPVPTVLAGLTVGQVLSVQLRGRTLVAVDSKTGAVAGALTPSSLVDLLACMNAGNQYVAHVKRLSKGLCEVEIRPK